MIEKLVEQIEGRFAELSQQMSDPDVIGDRDRYAEVGRAWHGLEAANELATEWRRASSDAAGAREMLEDGDDPELRELLAASETRLGELNEEIRLAMVEPDPADDKNVIVEIRAGTGGEEAGLFAGDLYRMLDRYADRRGFSTEALSLNDGDYTFAVKGAGAYSVFKHEGGTHRVQRVPETESQGRIHTSTATVAVLPEAAEVEVQIDPSDLQVDVYRSSGPGGQSVNTTDSAVRITHRPTGLVVAMQDEKSQLQNRDKAMRVLRARLYEQEQAARQAEQAESRRSQVGSGERAEKVRTYNFPQDRVTDHRVKLTKGEVARVLAGELDDFTAALEAEEKRLKLEAAVPSGLLTAAAPVRDAVGAATDALAAAGCESPRLDAEILVADALGVNRGALVIDPDRDIPGAAARVIAERVRRRVAREPVAYILGRKGFRHIELAVDSRVLDTPPRDGAAGGGGPGAAPWSAGARRGNGQRCGGTGPAPRTARHESERLRRLTGGGRGGASQCCAAGPGTGGGRHGGVAERRVRSGGGQPAVCGRARDAGPGSRDPPYEPREALVAGSDGLDAIRALIGAAPRSTRLALEHAPAPGGVRALALGGRNHAPDLAGHERVTLGTAP